MRYFILGIILFISGSSNADFISLIRADQCESIVEIFILENEIKITFEIGEKDFNSFYHIIPKAYHENGFTKSNKQEALNQFLKNDFTVVADGKLLSGTIDNIKRIPRNYRSSLYTGKLDTSNITISQYVIYAEAHIPLSRKPNKITITPPIEEGYKSTLANIGFVTYHKKVPVHDLRYLGQGETLNLNWRDPWYSIYNNKNLRRHHKNSIMEYLYIDPYEVRHEVLIRLKDLEYWIPLEYQIDDIIKSDEVDSIKQYVADFMIQRNRVFIDGIEAPPILDKVHFVQVAMSGIQIVEKPVDTDFATAIIGVIFAYPHDSIPQIVEVKWDMFSDDEELIPCMMTDPAGPFPYMLMKDDTALVWENFLKNYKIPTISEVEVENASVYVPVITILTAILLGALFRKNGFNIRQWKTKRKWTGILLILLLFLFWPVRWSVEIPFVKQKSFDVSESRILFSSLLKNTYRAFDFRSEGDVYDKLATSSEGNLLSEIYIQTKKSMVLENQGGLQVKLKNVEIVDAEYQGKDTDGLVFRTRWVVEGDVGHWGHIHKRTNAYDALIKIRSIDGIWKMYDMEIIEESRII